MNWKWKNSEQLFYEFFKIKAAKAIIMHEINFTDEIHFYTDVSEYNSGLIITQRKIEQKIDLHINTKMIEVSVLYDSFTFNRIQRKYFTYKKKLCAMITLVIKYNYLVKHFYQSAIIHTDHKFFIHFFISNISIHERIYEHWTDKMRIFNVKIKYISDFKNKITNDLFKIYFHEKDCYFISEISSCLHEIEKWIWSDKKNEYENFLKKLFEFEKKKLLKKKTFHEKTVFSTEMRFEFWIAIY